MTQQFDTRTTPSAPQINIGATIAITIAITAAVTVLSAMFGGFGVGTSAPQTRMMSLPVMLHLATVVPALLLGPVVLLRRKGDRVHRWLGGLWATLMMATAIASAFIHSPGAGVAGTGYSFIHIFTVWTLINVPLAVLAARRGQIARHRGMMTGLYVGLLIAGAFTMIPGRLLNSLVFGG